MTDGLERALAAHHRFEAREDRYVPTQTTFEATVRVADGVVRVETVVPTLDAAVEGETVAPVVEDGWYETFERRVEGLSGVTRADEAAVTSVERDEETVTVVTELRPSPETAGDDAIAVISFVEGTWMEGIIPGYDYVERVERLRSAARQNARAE